MFTELTISDINIRIECLRLAGAAIEPDRLKVAKEYYEWVMNHPVLQPVKAAA